MTIPADWTRDFATGRSNSSETFVELCKEIEILIHGSAVDLANERVDVVARLILAQLAHVHRLIPEKCLTE